MYRKRIDYSDKILKETGQDLTKSTVEGLALIKREALLETPLLMIPFLTFLILTFFSLGTFSWTLLSPHFSFCTSRLNPVLDLLP